MYGKSTPRLSKIIAAGYSEESARVQQVSFFNHHCFQISKDLIRQLAHRVAEDIKEVENEWDYVLPKGLNYSRIHVVALSRDGAMAPLLDAEINPRKAGYKEVMCGTICFYDIDQNLLHRIYIGVGSQSGKPAFNHIFDMETQGVKSEMKKRNIHPIYVGVADGARGNWEHLKPITDYQVTDYFHVAERVAKFAETLPFRLRKSGKWLEEQLHILKEEPKGAKKVLQVFEALLPQIKGAVKREKAKAQITYFTNQKSRMKYHKMRVLNLPIGSGPVEGACKEIVKRRLCGSGMRWLNGQADDIMAMRALHKTPGRIEQYWENAMKRAA